jgi:SMI1/KNR4 family protein SUKH-1
VSKVNSLMKLAGLRTALEARSVELRPPASEQSVRQLERELQLTLNETLRELYLQFDGFASCDSKSQMMLWPLERIVEEKELSQVGPEGRVFAIGDFLIDSDFLMSPLSVRGPVSLLEERRTLAPSVEAFLVKLTGKEFDFLE